MKCSQNFKKPKILAFHVLCLEFWYKECTSLLIMYFIYDFNIKLLMCSIPSSVDSILHVKINVNYLPNAKSLFVNSLPDMP